ncbi:hypothetical protein [Ensifer sp. Root31]|nr:hypothetical protein [Ensifer sp. Root31]
MVERSGAFVFEDFADAPPSRVDRSLVSFANMLAVKLDDAHCGRRRYWKP